MSSAKPPAKSAHAEEHEILFQKWFKSVGPRTYAAQVKNAHNGNQFLVLTEGKRDPKTDELRKTSIFVFSEDFAEFFKMLHEAAVFIREHPVPDDVKKRQDSYWKKRKTGAADAKKGDAAKRPAAMPASKSERTPVKGRAK